MWPSVAPVASRTAHFELVQRERSPGAAAAATSVPPSPTTTQRSDEQAVCVAATVGDEQRVKALLGRGAPVSAKALQWAAGNGQARCCRLLLERAPAEALGEALKVAVYNGHVDAAREILERPDADAGIDGGVCLFMAARHGNKELCEVLLARGGGGPASLESASASDGPMAWASARGHADVVALLLRHGLAPTRNALQWSAAGGHLEVVRVLLASGRCEAASVDLASVISSAGSIAVVAELLRHGARPDAAALDASLRARRRRAAAGHDADGASLVAVLTRGAAAVCVAETHLNQAVDLCDARALDILLDAADPALARRLAPGLVARVFTHRDDARFEALAGVLLSRPFARLLVPPSMRALHARRAAAARSLVAQLPPVFAALQKSCRNDYLSARILALAFGGEVVVTSASRPLQLRRANALLARLLVGPAIRLDTVAAARAAAPVRCAAHCQWQDGRREQCQCPSPTPS